MSARVSEKLLKSSVKIRRRPQPQPQRQPQRLLLSCYCCSDSQSSIFDPLSNLKAAPCNGHRYRNKFVILANASAASKAGSVSRPPRLSLVGEPVSLSFGNEKRLETMGQTVDIAHSSTWAPDPFPRSSSWNVLNVFQLPQGA